MSSSCSSIGTTTTTTIPKSEQTISTWSSYQDGEPPRFFATTSRHISAVYGLPTRHRPPLAHHLQLKWHLVMLLPLGKVSFTPSISLRSWGRTRTRSHSISNLQVQTSIQGNNLILVASILKCFFIILLTHSQFEIKINCKLVVFNLLRIK
jgi:hypothetical protein